MRIKWTVDDGYVYNGRLQTLDIEDFEFADCETEEDCMDLIYDCVQEQFMDHIFWEILDQDELKQQIAHFLENRMEEYVDVD